MAGIIRSRREIAAVAVEGATVVSQCLRLLDQSCDYAGDRIEHAPDIVGGARLTLEFGHDNLEQLISELGGAVGVEHVASEELVQSGQSGQIERRFSAGYVPRNSKGAEWPKQLDRVRERRVYCSWSMSTRQQVPTHVLAVIVAVGGLPRNPSMA